MFLLTLTAALALHASSTPAAAAAEPAPAEPIKTSATAERQICKTEALIGSRVPKRVCATKREWEARRREDKEALDSMQRASKPHAFQ